METGTRAVSPGSSLCTILPSSNSPLEGTEFGQAADGAYNVWVLVDVMEVQGQDVVLASDVHAVVVLVHAQDPVVRRVEQVSEVMGRPGGSQLCLTHKDNFTSAVIFYLLRVCSDN